MLVLKGHRYDKPVRSLAFSPDGRRLASSARDYKTFLWDLATGKHQVIDAGQSYTVAFSPDGRTLATGRSSGLSLWDAETGRSRTRELPYDRGHGWHLAFSPDGKLLAGASGTVRLWDAASLRELALHQSTTHASNCLAFSPDGATLATGHHLRIDGPGGRFVRLWDVATRKERGTLGDVLTGTIDALAFSPDGRLLAACAAPTLWVWEAASGAVVVRHKISDQHYKDVAFSPDGRFLAFARNDATVRFWDTGGWNEVAAFDWQVGPMISLAFAPDGMRAAGGSGKGKVVVWDVDL
jgi:WD40 repeat protein